MKKLYILKGYNNSFFRKPDIIKNSTHLFEGKKSIKKIEATYENIKNYKLEIIKKIDEGKDLYCYYEEIIAINDSDIFGLLDIEKIVLENNFFIEEYLIDFHEDDIEYILERFEEEGIQEKEENNIVQRFYSQLTIWKNTLFGKYNLLDKLEELKKIKEIDDTLSDKYKIEYIENIEGDIIEINNNSSKRYLNEILFYIYNENIKEISITSENFNCKIQDFLKRVSKKDISIYKTKKKFKEIEIPKDKISSYKEILKRKNPNFDFKKFEIYKDPYESSEKEMIEICQSKIIHEIVESVETSQLKSEEDMLKMRDIFVTAPTGTGKSVMFQIPAIYIAERYELVTIVITPLIGLMTDQVQQIASMTDKAVAINSDYTPMERDKALEGIRSGEKSILYLSPEGLINNGNIENLIGQDRKIGLVIVDEAHTMVTWGKSFRPDYLYLGDFLHRIRNQKSKYKFPIATFTATASINDNDNTHMEIIGYLNMNSNDYIGSVKRNNIKFKHNLELIGLDYVESKEEKVIESIKKFTKENIKTLVYFPYKKHIRDIKLKLSEDDLKKIAIYTGSSDKGEKRETLNDIKSGEKTVVLATKAFGMGIDIKDISHVYHYAPTGTISDYVQEIGRSARLQDMNGFACIDCFKNDSSFTKSLNGMNRINDYEIKAVLKKVYETYRRGQSRNFLTNPENFSYIFSGYNNEDLINRLKRIFLIIKKDFERDPNLNYMPIIFAPRAIFTKGYFLIQDNDLEKIKKFGYDKYFKLYRDKEELKHKEYHIGIVDVSYQGSIYEMNFKSMWEENFSSMSFNEFKYKLYKKELNFVKNIDIIPKALLKIETFKDEKILDILDKFEENINIMIEILKELRNKNSYFSREELSEIIRDRLGNRIDEDKSEIISKNIIEILRESYNREYAKKCIDLNKKNKKYIILNSSFERAFKKMIKSSHEFTDKTELSSVAIFVNKNSEKEDLAKKITLNIKVKIAMLLEAFGYATFIISSGFSPEVFIRVNSPTAIKNIIDNRFYSSQTLKDMKTADENNLKLMKIFIETKITDEEKWDFIEDYFLGNTDRYL